MSKITEPSYYTTYVNIAAPETNLKCIPAGSQAAQNAFTFRKIGLITGIGMTAFGSAMIVIGMTTLVALGSGAGLLVAGIFIGSVGALMTAYAAAGYDLSKAHAITIIEPDDSNQPTTYETLQQNISNGFEKLKDDLNEATK